MVNSSYIVDFAFTCVEKHWLLKREFGMNSYSVDGDETMKR